MSLLQLHLTFLLLFSLSLAAWPCPFHFANANFDPLHCTFSLVVSDEDSVFVWTREVFGASQSAVVFTQKEE